MKIAVFGYYNALNAGDDRIQYCITKLCEGNTVVFLPHYLPAPQEYLRDFDWILIGGGGLVFERVGIWVNTKQWLRKTRAKVGILGLGVNRVSDELLIELSYLLERSVFFFVRDEKSKLLLNNHPKIQVHPDLTWCFPFLPSNNQLTIASKKIAVNLVPCHWKDFEPDKWIVELKKLSDFQLIPFPFNFNLKKDVDLLKLYFNNINTQEFSLQPLQDSQIIVACRYHAIVFAMQLGKPFIAINYDEKIERLLRESDLVECGLETTEYELLLEKIDFILNNQKIVQKKINDYANLQTQNAKELTKSIKNYLLYEPENKNKIMIIKENVKKILMRV
ncbi:polysaccharide pyruvyl transferase [Nostoc sp. NIES-3756]|uniref:polysaccharide pyruvyl transferase family protein n=1 Tax=Nostoc sp. NIES-3756 TaxID=1751286 RepID=UPI0007226E89|nr:polysaccharide pyruvyl transferase family protein [Nostoc sp. NIES-3756]BAT55544.1 polysaccharide pyruvyl transferase [Nostoc sp. NIES-3756]